MTDRECVRCNVPDVKLAAVEVKVRIFRVKLVLLDEKVSFHGTAF
jgi:hypothetical protein